ncbi:hypothetical protein N2152v2_011132 [Parachlorella kessleri]
MTVTKTAQDAGLWVFGYGSLVHNPGYKYSASVEGYIRGWRRVFHQGSTDHRGVPEAPGRTVTLEAAPGAVTWGVAYRLAGDSEEQQRTLAYLEWREKQYDLRVHVDVYSRHHPDVPAVRGALTYVATSDRSRNPNYLGPAEEEVIAHQIATSQGPSGPNHEYLFRLADAMRQMSVVDDELFQLEVLVRQRMAALGLSAAEVAAAADVVTAAEVAAAAAGLPLGMAGPEAAAAAGSAAEAAACAAEKLESLCETLEGGPNAAAAGSVEAEAGLGSSDSIRSRAG